MTTILVSNLLYKNPTTIPVKCVSDMKLGGIAPAGVGVSKARKDGSVTGAKLSAAALVLDAIIDGKVSAVEGENCVFTQYKRSDGTVFSCLAEIGTSPRIRYAETKPELNWEILIPFFVLETRKSSSNTEFRSLVESLAKTRNTPAILQMCDALYFGSSRRTNVEIEESDISIETVQAALRSGLLRQGHEVLKMFDAPSVDVGGVTVEKTDTTHKAVDDISSSSIGEFENILSGKNAIAYPWTDEQKQRIPSLKTLNDFVPTSAFWKGSRKIKYRTDKILERLDMGLTGLEALGKDTINFFMTGKPGTGKTTVAKALAAAYQLPFYSIPIQKGTEEGTFQGLLKARDGKFVFTSTDFLDAFKNGGIIVLEELNLADPAILSGAIGQAIESPYFVMEDEITPVYRHPMCIIIGTFNVGTAGSKEINPMLSSRFYQTYLVEDPDEGEFVARLMKFDCNKHTAKKIYTAYNRILDYLKSPDVSALEYCKNVTFRGCVGAIQCLRATRS